MLSILRRTTTIILITNFQGLISGILVSYIIATNYPIDIQGYYYLLTSMVAWFIFCDLGISHTLLYLSNNKKIDEGVGFYIFIYYVLSISILLLITIINREYLSSYGFIFLISSLINTSCSIILHLYRSRNNEDTYWKLRIIEYTIYNSINVTLLFIGYGIESLLISTILSTCINIIYIIRTKTIKNIGFSFTSWALNISKTQFKCAIDYISSFIGVKPLIPLIAPLLTLEAIGKLGLSLTLISILTSSLITIYLSYINKLKSHETKKQKEKIKLVSSLMIYIYIFASIIILAIQSSIPINLAHRLLNFNDMIIILVYGLTILGLNITSSYKRLFGIDNSWKTTISYNLIICISIYTALSHGYNYSYGFLVAYLYLIIIPVYHIIKHKLIRTS